jgi:hypothetical protein
MFDYGKRKNLKIYHSEVPPLYPIENVTVPVYLVSSANDSIISLKVKLNDSIFIIVNYF